MKQSLVKGEVLDYINEKSEEGISMRVIAEEASKRFNKNINFHNVRKAVNNIDFISQKTENAGVKGTNWKRAWLKDEETSILIENPLFKEEVLCIIDKFDEVCSKYSYKIPKATIETVESTSEKALQVVISDSHVGLDPNPDSNSLFQYEYSGDIYREKIMSVFPNIMKEFNLHGKFEELYLIDLGDREDGLGGQTTRGGHSLPQNMSDIEVFETCIDAKMNLLQSVIESDVADKIIIRDVVNSNHSSAFAHMVSLATSKLIEKVYGSIVTVEILGRYMEHRVYGEHCFIYTHGKDAKHQFKGLPLHLDAKAENFIREYIDHYEINSRYIHVLKGDLHQIGYNKTKKFDYRNFPAFAPGSSWQQHNFGDSYSGYSVQVIPKDKNEISTSDYFIDYKKK